jgi:hypothetical protein
MNGYEYRQSNSAFDERLRQEIAKVKREFKNGNIKTQTDYIYALKQIVVNFYKNLGKPTFKFHPTADVPSYTNYVDMVTNAIADMTTVVVGTQTNYSSLSAAKDKTDEAIDILLKRIDGIVAVAEDLENKINSIRRAADTVFSDDFTQDDNMVNTNKSNATLTDTATGALMLGVSKNKSSSSDNINVEILDTSNGFPGTTHEIFNSVGTVNNNIKFKGENNPHIDLNLIKTNHGDNLSTNDWFEFEMFNIADSLRESTCMIGFNYKEGVSWVNEDDELRLDMKFTLDNPSEANYLILQGTPKSNANVSNPMIYQVSVSDDDVLKQTIDVNKELVGTVVIPFTPQKAKTVIVKLRQPEYLAVKVCRQYAVNVDPTKISKYIDDDFKDFIQVDRPNQSIELLGLKYDQQTGKIIYPNTKSTTTFMDAEYYKSQLFYNTQSKNNYKIEQEAVDAHRFSIGLKEADVRYRMYIENGYYVSKTFESQEPIKQLTLNSDDFIPEAFRDYLAEGQDFNNFIKYYISFDDGSEWHQISPRHKAHTGPCTILINSNSAVLNRNANMIYLDMINDPYSFKVKIELSRPKELFDETPIVYEYNVDVSTREEFE